MSELLKYLITKQVEFETEGEEYSKIKVDELKKVTGTSEEEIEEELLKLVNSGAAEVEIDNNLDMIVKYKVNCMNVKELI